MDENLYQRFNRMGQLVNPWEMGRVIDAVNAAVLSDKPIPGPYGLSQHYFFDLDEKRKAAMQHELEERGIAEIPRKTLSVGFADGHLVMEEKEEPEYRWK